MKKTLIAVAALAATSAFAQATVYGRMDVGYGVTEVTNANTGAASATNVVSGKNSGFTSRGLNTSLWGFKASEDLGGGMKANVQMEADVFPNDGTVGTGFNRTSTVGLSGGFGSVNIGRYYTPLFLLATGTDPFATTGATTVNLYGDGVRVNNSLFYNGSFGPVSVAVAYGNNNSETVAPATATTTKSDNLGASVTYANGPLMVTAAMGNLHAANATVDTQKVSGTGIGATYDLKVVKIWANMLQQTVNTNAGGTSAVSFGGYGGNYVAGTDNKQSEINVGVTAPVGAVTLMAMVGQNKIDNTVDTFTGTDMVVGATYAMGKNTALYVKTGTYNKVDIAGGGDAKTTTTALGLKTAF